jgi:hypothetical protein
LSSGGSFECRPSACFVVGRVGLEAVPEFGQQLVREVAERGVVGVIGGFAAVVVGSGSG